MCPLVFFQQLHCWKSAVQLPQKRCFEAVAL